MTTPFGRSRIKVSSKLAVVACGALLASMVGGVGAVDAAPKMCDGKTATIVGTSGDDILNGTTGPDVIVGLAGDDTINGADGNDTICGGRGDDTIFGAAGRDKLFGDKGDDTIVGGNGRDRLDGGPGVDTVDGESGNKDHCIGEIRGSQCELPIVEINENGSLAGATRGMKPAKAMRKLTQAFGEPDSFSPAWIPGECNSRLKAKYAVWGPITAVFLRGADATISEDRKAHFVQWNIDPAKVGSLNTLNLPGGTTTESTLDELAAAAGVQVMTDQVGNTPGFFFMSSEWSAEGPSPTAAASTIFVPGNLTETCDA